MSRTMKRALPLLAATWLTACTSHPPPPQDDAMEVAITAGRQAMDNHRPDQAIPRFEDADRRALLRDDADALADIGYDLAAARLADGHPDAALAELERTRAALALRGHPAPPALDLVAAASLDRLARFPEAQAAATRAATSPDPAIAARALFLTGLIADHAGDRATLSDAATRLDRLDRTPHLPRWREADRLELEARAALATGRPDTALTATRAAIDLRRDDTDYPALRRTLRLAATISRALHRPNLAAAYDTQADQSLSAAAAPQVFSPRVW